MQPCMHVTQSPQTKTTPPIAISVTVVTATNSPSLSVTPYSSLPEYNYKPRIVHFIDFARPSTTSKVTRTPPTQSRLLPRLCLAPHQICTSFTELACVKCACARTTCTCMQHVHLFNNLSAVCGSTVINYAKEGDASASYRQHACTHQEDISNDRCGHVSPTCSTVLHWIYTVAVLFYYLEDDPPTQCKAEVNYQA